LKNKGKSVNVDAFFVAFSSDLQLPGSSAWIRMRCQVICSCSRILRLDPEQQPGETAWKWTGMDRNGLQRLRRGTGKIFAGAEVHRPGKRPYRAAA